MRDIYDTGTVVTFYTNRWLGGTMVTYLQQTIDLINQVEGELQTSKSFKADGTQYWNS